MVIPKDGSKWKKSLRDKWIIAMTGNQYQKYFAYRKTDKYYADFAPRVLYKYYGSSLERFKTTIKANKIWCSAPCNFNDVFDCDISIDKKKMFINELQKNENRDLRKNDCKWKQLEDYVCNTIQTLQDNFETVQSQIGISCFSELSDSLLMWAHYADNHRGICVEYDLSEIIKQKKPTPVPVIYSDKRVCIESINQDNLYMDLMRFFIESITSKSPEWSYEKEWRMIVNDKVCGDTWNSEEKGALLDIVCPSSIILGCMATPEFETSVHNYCETNKINLYKMAKSSEQYKLEKRPIFEFDDADI